MWNTSSRYQNLLERGATYRTALGIDRAVPYMPFTVFHEDVLREITVTNAMFDGDEPCVGACVAGEIDVTMDIPNVEIPRMARLQPFVQLRLGSEVSEWISKGCYFIDSREVDEDAGTVRFHGYDALLAAEADFDPGDTIQNWPRRDIDVVNDIARGKLGTFVDERTTEIMDKKYMIELPTGYSCREVLGYIAAMYGGNFIMSGRGLLRLVRLADVGNDDDSYLIDEWGNGITFGGDLIHV